MLACDQQGERFEEYDHSCGAYNIVLVYVPSHISRTIQLESGKIQADHFA